MGVRLTGISTPVGGVSTEYTKAEEQVTPQPIVPDQKIKVFISSNCGDEGKYDRVRADLKKAIEDTQLADVYLFENEDVSTLSAGSHYTLALEDSDICIFLIDNADGIKSGVQDEVDTVKKRNIKALYYFCDENSKEKTVLEHSVMGSRFAKSKTVHKFDDLSQNGAHALINDIIKIYHYYCQGKITLSSEDNNDDFQTSSVAGSEKLQMPTMPKSVLKNVDKCKDYIIKLTIGHSFNRFPNELEKTGKIDDWGVQFLPILFEGKSIRQFNTGVYLETLKEQQTDTHYQVVQVRWQAIQAYFLGDVMKCVQYLEKALKLAKELEQPSWVIKDILIDLRNQHWTLNTINNCYFESSAQEELTDSKEELYYPILDRIHESLHEKYIDGMYKKKIELPYSVTLVDDLNQYCELLASSIIITMYNGSLTHILLFYEKIRDFLFYLSCKYNDWNIRRDLLKLAIYAGKEKEIKGIRDSYPEVLNNLGADDAAVIMEFCKNHPVSYKRFNSFLLAFGVVGYYLNDENFAKYEAILLKEIREWMNEGNLIVALGQSIFHSLSGVSYRMSQDVLAEICCTFIDMHFSRWYMDVFNFIARYMDLHKMSPNYAKTLIEHIISVLEDDKQRTGIQDDPSFLCILRKQDKAMTELLDKKVAEYFPEYYNGDYKLETAEVEKQNWSVFIQRYVKRIKESNDTQGKGGRYFGHGTRDIATVRLLLLEKNFECDDEMMDSIISTVADTLLVSKEGIGIKLDAISLLICIVVRYPDAYNRNYSIFEKLVNTKEKIEASEIPIISSNIDSISLKIGLQFLFTTMGNDTYSEILELMPYIQNDVATTISVTRIIVEYLETTDHIVLPKKIEAIVLQNVLQWLCSDCLDVRLNATKILLKMLRNPENQRIVNHQLISLSDSDNVYIKNLIMCNIYETEGIAATTRDYIIAKYENDPNFVVRMVCSKKKHLLAHE